MSDFIQTVRRGYTRLSDGKKFEVDVEINVNEIARSLAARAIKSKSGESIAMNGDIKCKVVNSEFPVGTKPLEK